MAPSRSALPPNPKSGRLVALAQGPNSLKSAPKPRKFPGAPVLVTAHALPQLAKRPPMQWPDAVAPAAAIG